MNGQVGEEDDQASVQQVGPANDNNNGAMEVEESAIMEIANALLLPRKLLPMRGGGPEEMGDNVVGSFVERAEEAWNGGGDGIGNGIAMDDRG